MKFVDEYRDPGAVRELLGAICRITTKPWRIMEVCGGQTHTILRYGLQALLPDEITLLHGPGCPVCVTPQEIIDAAIDIAARPEVIFCSFGDMLRVPGSCQDLLSVRAEGGDVRMVYSPLDAVTMAQQNPDKQVVFFAVGFETTVPANALAVYQAAQQGLTNFSLLVSQVLVPPAMELLLAGQHCQIQGFLAAGHVCAVMGYSAYQPLAARYHCPVVVTGFEPLDILQGIYLCIKQLEEGRAEVENQYRRAVKPAGNREAQALINNVFATVDQSWRGIGTINSSGLSLAPAYQHFDARARFAVKPSARVNVSECISGLVLQGLKKPNECPAFGSRCIPDHPLGATMVSGEGACAAYYRFGRGESQYV